MRRVVLPSFFTREKMPDVELKFAEYLGKFNGVDKHLLKLKVKEVDGTWHSKLEILENFQMPFWVTKKLKRNHEDKKEYEKIENTDMFLTSQGEMVPNVARRLGLRKDPKYCSKRDVTASPYVYGLGISATSYIKEWFIHNGANSPWNYVTLDSETDIEDPMNQFTTHITISSKTESMLAVLKSRFHGHGYKNDDEIREAIKREYIANVPDGENMWYGRKRRIELYNDFPSMIEAIFAQIHKWDPDIVGVWNLAYDMDLFIQQYEGKYQRSMARLFCNPQVPLKNAIFEWSPGRLGVTTKLDNGKEKNKTFKPHEVWSSVRSSAGFKMVCAMQMFYQIRCQGPDQEGGYSLDNVATRIAKVGKVKDDSPYVKAKWHIETSKHKPAFYACYGMYDVDIMHIIEDKTNDMTVTGPTQLASAEWSTFNSLPVRLHTAFHFHILKQGYCVGTKGGKYEKPFSELSPAEQKEYVPKAILGIGRGDDEEGWIATLPAHKIKTDFASDILTEGFEDLKTYHFGHVYDMDEVSAYPRATVAGNVSIETTKGELIDIDGIPKDTFIIENINLIGNKANYMGYATRMLSLPGFDELSKLNVKEYL